jgi:hypothetical protein
MVPATSLTFRRQTDHNFHHHRHETEKSAAGKTGTRIGKCHHRQTYDYRYDDLDVCFWLVEPTSASSTRTSATYENVYRLGGKWSWSLIDEMNLRVDD